MTNFFIFVKSEEEISLAVMNNQDIFSPYYNNVNLGVLLFINKKSSRVPLNHLKNKAIINKILRRHFSLIIKK